MVLILLTTIHVIASQAGSIRTNEVVIPQAPPWLNESKVDRVVQRIQRKLEWDIRKIQVFWYQEQAPFQKVHGFDASVLAFTQKRDMSVHMGPRVDSSNFEAVFGHELVHVILSQKYKQSVPKWLEEGVANYTAQMGQVDYLWLQSQPRMDVTKLEHPFKNLDPTQGQSAKLHYMTSSALIEMIAHKCNLFELLQLSVGKGLTPYLSTFCGISDVNSDFNEWLNFKAKKPKKV